jgi:hypothetical protein
VYLAGKLKRIGGRGFANFFCPDLNGGWIRKASYISQSGLRPAISNLESCSFDQRARKLVVAQPSQLPFFFARDAGDLVIFSNHKTARALTRHDARPGRSLPAAVTRMWRPSTLDSLKRTDGILRQAPKMGEMHVIPQAISRQSCVLLPSVSASSRRQPPADPRQEDDE